MYGRMDAWMYLRIYGTNKSYYTPTPRAPPLSIPSIPSIAASPAEWSTPKKQGTYLPMLRSA